MNYGAVYLGLGSNLGDRGGWIESAVSDLRALPKFTLLRRAEMYSSRALGKRAGGEFLNTALAGLWEGTPKELLEACQSLEQAHGRMRPFADAPRTLDIDLLWWEGVEMSTTDLTLPHPRLSERAFALVPLLEIAPELIERRGGLRLSASLSPALLQQGIENASPSKAYTEGAHG